MAKPKKDQPTVCQTAPVAPSDRDSHFPPVLVKAAQDAAKATGCWASVALAQSALESGYFKYVPPDSFNCLGIKASAGHPFVECKTKEIINGQSVTVTAKFRKFDSFEDCLAVHGRLVTNPKGPYAGSLRYIHDRIKWVRSIALTYASDRSYADKIITLIEQWHLSDFDV